MNKTRNDRVLIIDSLNSYMRIFSSMADISERGDYIGGILGFLRSIGSNIRDFKPTRCILVWDGSGGSQRRKKVFPEYKANRNGSSGLRKDLFSSVEEEKQVMRTQMAQIFKYFENLPVEVYCVPNVEADDVIAYMTMQYFNPLNSKVRIVSTDRDFLQLVSPNVEVYSPVKKKLYTNENFYQELNLTPEEYLTFRVVTGDVSDNIDGVPGIGLKTLVKSFPQPTSIQRLIEESKQKIQEEKKPKQIFKNIVENEQLLERNYYLMQLQETDISGATKINLFERLENPKISKTNNYQIRKLMMEDGLATVFKNVDEWLLMTFSGLNVWTT